MSAPNCTLSDALCILESTIGVMNARIEAVDSGAADAVRTLLKIAHTSLVKADAENTLDQQDEISRSLYEADAVLTLVATAADDAATWGALTLLELCKKTLDAAVNDTGAAP